MLIIADWKQETNDVVNSKEQHLITKPMSDQIEHL